VATRWSSQTRGDKRLDYTEGLRQESNVFVWVDAENVYHSRWDCSLRGTRLITLREARGNGLKRHRCSRQGQKSEEVIVWVNMRHGAHYHRQRDCPFVDEHYQEMTLAAARLNRFRRHACARAMRR